MISFKANFVDYRYVNKMTENGEYKRKKVAFVELDPNYPGDQQTIRNVSRSWLFDNTYAKYISSDFLKSNEDSFEYVPGRRFFAITNQRYSFLNLPHSDVLGLVEMSVDDIEGKEEDCIKWLQVKPDCCWVNEEYRPFLNVGKAILKSIKKIYKKDIYVDPNETAFGFYKKNGFEIFSEKYGTTMVLKRTPIHKI